MSCRYNPENYDGQEVFICPECGHIVMAGLPHPDYSTKDLPVSEEELARLSQINKET
jgi:hypothetical protein